MKKIDFKKLVSMFFTVLIVMSLLPQTACRSNDNGQSGSDTSSETPPDTTANNNAIVLAEVRSRLKGLTLTVSSGETSVVAMTFITSYAQTDLETGVSGSGTGESAVDTMYPGGVPNVYSGGVPRLVWAGDLDAELSREATLVGVEILDPEDVHSSIPFDGFEEPPKGDCFVLYRYKYEWNEGSKQGSADIEFVVRLIVPAVS